MEQKKICRTCSNEIDSKRKNKIFCNMACYKNFKVKPKQEILIVNKHDPNFMTKFFKFLSGK